MIGVVSTSGTGLTQYPAGNNPTQIIVGPEGNGHLWFIGRLRSAGVQQLGRITAQRVVQLFTLADADPVTSNPTSILADPVAGSNALWVTDTNSKIYRCVIQSNPQTTPVCEFFTADPSVRGLALGGNGLDIWVLSPQINGVYRIISLTGSPQIYSYPNAIPSSTSPFAMVAGPTASDNVMWFTEQSGLKLGKLTYRPYATSPTITVNEFPNRFNVQGMFGITVGPDKNIWFTLYDNGTAGNLNFGVL
jgi:streptogramin lyase